MKHCVYFTTVVALFNSIYTHNVPQCSFDQLPSHEIRYHRFASIQYRRNCNDYRALLTARLSTSREVAYHITTVFPELREVLATRGLIIAYASPSEEQNNQAIHRAGLLDTLRAIELESWTLHHHEQDSL